MSVQINKIENSKLFSDNDCLEVLNYSTTAEALKFAWFRTEILKKFPNLIVILVKIDEKLDIKHADAPKIHEYEDRDKIIIIYESIKDECQKIIFWKREIEENFHTIRLFNEYSAQVTSFVCEFFIDALQNELSVKLNEWRANITSVIDSNNFNILMRAVKYQNTDIIAELLKFPFDLNQKSVDEQTAADFAWEMKSFDILLQLLKSDSTYPSDFDQNIAPDEIKAFLNISNDLHTAIVNNDETKVNEILANYSDLKHFYNSKNFSAVSFAIYKQNFKFYEILTQNNVYAGPLEKFDQMINKFLAANSQIKEQIRDLHSNVAQIFPEKYILVHCTNSVIAHDNLYVRERSQLIKSAYETLDKMPLIRKILQVTAAYKNFKTHFDFNRNSVQQMDPFSGGMDTRGIYYPNGHVYVAGKELLDESEKFNAIGTLAHELCHFAMSLTFCNNAKPFALDDIDERDKFVEIVKACHSLREKEDIIARVFDCYPQSAWCAELIVRVPQIIAHYHNDLKKLTELQETFNDLFKYFNDVVMLKMNEVLPLIEMLYSDSNELKFSNLTDAYKTKFSHSTVEFQGHVVIFSEINESKNSETFDIFTSEQIRGILNEKENIKISDANKFDIEFYIERKFIDFEIDTNDLSVKLDQHSLDFNKILDIAISDRLFILSDLVGAGKTTTFKHLTMRLNERYHNYWVSYVDLRKHFAIYEKYEGIENFNCEDMLVEILALKNNLELQFFHKLYETNKVILLYDGDDEVSLRFKIVLFRMIRNIRNSTTNQQWIASNSHHSTELMESFNSKAYKLVPYDEREIRKYIGHFLIKHNINENEIDKSIDELSRFDTFFKNPLMLEKILNLYVQDRTIITYKNTYSLFDRMINETLSVLEKKGDFVGINRDNKNSSFTIWHVHQVYAMKLIYRDGIRDFLADDKKIYPDKFSLIKRWKSHQDKWKPEEISRYGFLIVDNWTTQDELPHFLHKILAEILIVQFIIENIFDLNEDDDEISEKEIGIRLKLLYTCMYETCGFNAMQRLFIMNYIEMDPQRNKINNRKVLNFLQNGEVFHYIDYELRDDKNVIFDFLNIFKVDMKLWLTIKDENGSIFQRFFKNSKKLDPIYKIVEIYEESFDNNWTLHTGYNMKNPNLPHDFNSLDNKKLFKLLNFIKQAEIPNGDIDCFFNNNLSQILTFTLETQLIDELFEIIEMYNNDSKMDKIESLLRKVKSPRNLLKDFKKYEIRKKISKIKSKVKREK